MLPHPFPTLLAVLGASLLPPAASLAASPRVTETITLRHVRPSAVADMVAANALLFTGDLHGGHGYPSVPAGLTLVAPDDVKNTLTLGGSARSVAEFKGALRLLDVPEHRPRRFRLRVRLLRYRLDTARAGDAPYLEEAARMAADTGSKRAADLSCVVDGRVFHLRLSPHANADESVTIGADLRDAGGPYRPQWADRPAATHTAAAGQAMTFMGGARAAMEHGRARVWAVEQGRPLRPGEEAGYCLEVTASPLPEQSSSPPSRRPASVGRAAGGAPAKTPLPTRARPGPTPR